MASALACNGLARLGTAIPSSRRKVYQRVGISRPDARPLSNEGLCSGLAELSVVPVPAPWCSRNVCACASAAAGGSSSSGPSFELQLQGLATTLTRLFPLWVVLAAVSGYYRPETWVWFDSTCISNGLVFIMLGMGITLTLDEIFMVFRKQPQLLLLGMVLQYTVLPTIGFVISRFWGLEAGLAVGVALVSCMPGGTASNIIAYIAKGEMPLSIMMTTASTLMAIFTTPLLTSILVGTLVPVDPKAMFLSVLQLVLAPVLLGATINTYLPGLVARVKPFLPLAATIMCVYIIGSMVGTNVGVLNRSGLSIMGAVAVLHLCGFSLGYFISKGMGLSDKICRTNSIEVGMQSSALAGVLAQKHFPQDPTTVAPCVLSAVVMCFIGSILAGIWNISASD